MNDSAKNSEQSYADLFDECSLSSRQKLKAFPRFVPRQQQASYLFRWEVFKRVCEVQGSIVELGVYLGAGLFSFANFSAITEPYNYQRKIIGFDTFAGFPEVTGKDQTTSADVTERKPGGYSVPEDQFQQLHDAAAVFDGNRYLNQRQKIELIKGDVSKTVPAYLEANPHTLLSLLYLDLDLYRPTFDALEHLYDRVVPGGIVAFDEANDPRWPGETTALLEFFNNQPGHIGRLERYPFEPAASFFVKQ